MSGRPEVEKERAALPRDVLFHIWEGVGRVPVAEIAVSWPVDAHEEPRVLVLPHISEPGLRFVFGGHLPGASLIAEVVDRRLGWLQHAAAADAAAARDAVFPVEGMHPRENANIFSKAADFTVYGASMEPTQLHFDHWVGRQRVPTGDDFVDLVLRQLAASSDKLSEDVLSADQRNTESARWAREALDILDLMDRTAMVANGIDISSARASHDRALLLEAVEALRRQLPLHGLTTLCIVDGEAPTEDLQWLLRAHLAGSNPGIPTGRDIRDLVRTMRQQVVARNTGLGS